MLLTQTPLWVWVRALGDADQGRASCQKQILTRRFLAEGLLEDSEPFTRPSSSRGDLETSISSLKYHAANPSLLHTNHFLSTFHRKLAFSSRLSSIASSTQSTHKLPRLHLTATSVSSSATAYRVHVYQRKSLRAPYSPSTKPTTCISQV